MSVSSVILQLQGGKRDTRLTPLDGLLGRPVESALRWGRPLDDQSRLPVLVDLIDLLITAREDSHLVDLEGILVGTLHRHLAEVRRLLLLRWRFTTRHRVERHLERRRLAPGQARATPRTHTEALRVEEVRLLHGGELLTAATTPFREGGFLLAAELAHLEPARIDRVLEWHLATPCLVRAR